MEKCGLFLSLGGQFFADTEEVDLGISEDYRPMIRFFKKRGHFADDQESVGERNIDRILPELQVAGYAESHSSWRCFRCLSTSFQVNSLNHRKDKMIRCFFVLLTLLWQANFAFAEVPLCELVYAKIFPRQPISEFLYSESQGSRIANLGKPALRASEDSPEIITRLAQEGVALRDGRIVPNGRPQGNSLQTHYLRKTDSITERIPQGESELKVNIREADGSLQNWKLYLQRSGSSIQASAASRQGPWEPFEKFFHLRSDQGVAQLGLKTNSGNIVFEKSTDPRTGEKTWSVWETISLAALAPKGNPPPSAKEFAKLFPHDIYNLSKNQSSFLVMNKFGDQKSFLLRSYDPASGKVLLQAEELRILQSSPVLFVEGMAKEAHILDLLKEERPSIFISGKEYHVDLQKSTENELHVHTINEGKREDFLLPLQLNGNHYVQGIQGLSTKDLAAGKIVSLDGEKFEVVSVGEKGLGKVVLRKVEQLEMNWDQFSALATNRASRIPSPKAIVNGAVPANLPFSEAGKRNIRLVGRNGVRKISQKTEFMDDFRGTKRQVDLPQFLKEISEVNFPKGTKIEISADGMETTYVADGENRGLKRGIRILLESGTGGESNLAKFSRLKIELPAGLPPQILEQEAYRGKGTVELKTFDVSPKHGKEILFQVKGAKGEHSVTVRFPLGDAIENEKLETMAEEVLAHLPYEHADSTNLILLENDHSHLGSNYTAFALTTTSKESGKEIRQIELLKNFIDKKTLQSRMEIFWHETGHLIAENLWHSKNNPSLEYARAVALDGRFVSGYALHQYDEIFENFATNLPEDFAETVAAYISSDGGRLIPGLREALPNRFAVLDRVFQIETGRNLINSAVSTTSRNMGIAITAISTSVGTVHLISDSKEGNRP